MTLAVSNIAWTRPEEAEAAATLERLGVTGVEIAPTAVWDDPLAVTTSAVTDHIGFWASRGIGIVAFQSLLFGRSTAALFGDDQERSEAARVLDGFIELADRMRVPVLVLGAPKNRRTPVATSPTAAFDSAVRFFAARGRRAASAGVRLCIEPNPPQYECDFVTTSAEGIALVDAVGSPGFGLHLDIAAMTLAGEDPATGIRAAGTRLQHFHVSAPWLGPLERAAVDHERAGRALDEAGYTRHVSIEMRADAASPIDERLTRAIALTRAAYPAARPGSDGGRAAG